MKPFKEIFLKERSFFQVLFKKYPRSNFIIEVNNVFCKFNSFDKELKNEIDALRFKYKIKPTKSLTEQLAALYEQLLTHYFIDKQLSKEELDNLSIAQEILDIPNSIVKSIYEKVSRNIYKKTVDDIISDGKVTDEEKSFLKDLGSQLKLSEEVMKNIYSTSVQDFFSEATKSVVQDERISPEEEQYLEEIAKNLGATVTIDEKSKTVFDRYKFYWKIENEDLPQINADIILQKNEICYSVHRLVDWYEMRSITKRYNYAGPTARIKIAKGIYYRVGSINLQPVKQDLLTFIDNGVLYLTNKRLIFRGSKKVINIQLKKIIDLNPYTNGIEIVKDSGKSPLLKFNDNVDIMYLILNRVIREN